MSSAEYKRAKYREMRADPVAFARYQEKQARSYRARVERDPTLLSKHAKQRKPLRYQGDALEKVRCRQATQNAIQSGLLVKGSCEVCGVAKVDAHHDDYRQPLMVRWLCPKHHYEHHSRLWCEQNGIDLAALKGDEK